MAKFGREAPATKAAMSAGPHWKIVERRLSLRLPSGRVVTPTASEVIGAEFKSKMLLRDERISRRPSQSLPHVLFSRYPPEVSLAVTPPSSDLSAGAICGLQLRV